MVIVHDSDKYKYFDKQRKVDIIKYSNGVKKVVEGSTYQEGCIMVMEYSMI